MIGIVRVDLFAAVRECAVKLWNRLIDLYLDYCSKPAGDRSLFRSIHRTQPHRIVHIGLDSVERSKRLLDVVTRNTTGSVQYTGIDLFEAGGKIKLKDFHRDMQRDGVKLKLVPGDPYAGLARFANVLTETNLLLIGKDVDEQAMQHAWFYVPRMLADSAIVLRETNQGEDHFSWEMLPVEDVFAAADAQRSARRAA
jgi:hypothetical protein